MFDLHEVETEMIGETLVFGRDHRELRAATRSATNRPNAVESDSPGSAFNHGVHAIGDDERGRRRIDPAQRTTLPIDHTNHPNTPRRARAARDRRA